MMNSSTFKHLPLFLFSNANHKLSSMVLLLLLLLLLPQLIRPAGAQPGSTFNDGYTNQKFNTSTGIVILVLIFALFFMGFFTIYIRSCADNSSFGRHHLQLIGLTLPSRRGPRGLDAVVIDTFPTFLYSDVKNSKIGKGALECAICLNEFEDDETLRLITKCDHVFHTDCIDSWLVAHTTCPVCRANLAPQLGESTHDHSIELDQVNDDVVVEVSQDCEVRDGDSMERPLQAPELSESSQRLNRNRTRRNVSGRARWFGRFSRSNSTGHVAVRHWENLERFTLRVPEEVRRQIISGKLRRSTSLVVLPWEGSSRRGYRGGYGEGSSRGHRGGYGEGSSRGRLSAARLDRAGGKSERWVFSLAPPFFSRTPSMKSPKVATSGGESFHGSSKTGSFVESGDTGKVDNSVGVNAGVETNPV